MPTTFDFIEDAAPATTQFDFQPDEIVERPERTRLIRAPLPNLPPESRKVLQEMSQQPLVNIPAEVFIPPWTQMVGPTVAKSAQAMGEETAAAASGFTSPLNLGLLAATKVAPQMGVAIAATMIPQIGEGIQETVRGIRAGDIPASVRGATKTALTGTMAVLGGLAPFHTKLLPRATAEAAREGVPVVESEPSVVAPTPTVPVEIPPKIAAVEQAARRAEIKAARPVVPETPPETERGLTVLEEIRAKGADTKAKIQALYPQLSRETAGKLRDQAFPREKIPDNLSRQDVDRLFLDKLNEESNREIEQATAAPKPAPLTPVEQAEARADLGAEIGEEPPQAPVTPEPAPAPETPAISAPEAKAPQPLASGTRDWDAYYEDLVGDLDSFAPARQTGRASYEMDDVAERFVDYAKKDKSGKPLTDLVNDFSKQDEASTAQIKKLKASVRNLEPTPPAKVEAPAAKEPWQMTRQQYRDKEAAGFESLSTMPEGKDIVGMPVKKAGEHKVWQAQQKAMAEKTRSGNNETVDLMHKRLVKKAIEQGKPVPIEVLAEYPDIAPKPAAKPAAETGKETPVSPSGVIEARPEMEGGVSKSLTGQPSKDVTGEILSDAAVAPIRGRKPSQEEISRSGGLLGAIEEFGETASKTAEVASKQPKSNQLTATERKLYDAIQDGTVTTRWSNQLQYGRWENVDHAGMGDSMFRKTMTRLLQKGAIKLYEEGRNIRLSKQLEPKPPETPPTGPGISAGPGAAAGGEPGTYSPISQLTDQMATSPVKNLREAIGIGERLSDAWAQGKDSLTRTLGKLRVVPGALKRSWKGIRDLNEVEERVAANDWVLQQSSAKSKQAGEAIRQAIPASQVRDGMAIWIDAAGDETAIRDTLANLPPGTKPRVRRALESALNLPDEVKTHATNLSDYYARRAEEAQSEEVLNNVLEDYFTHVWKKPANMPDSVKGALNSGRINEYFKYARHRKLPTFLEGILQGKEPVLDPAEVIPHYNYLMDRAIASRRFIKSLEEAKMPDGKPVLGPWGTRAVIGDPGEGAILIKLRGKPEDYNAYRQIDHPALRKWKWAATDEEGRPVFYEGTLAVHPEAYERLARIMDRSRLTSGKITRALLRVSGEVKGAKLGLLSPFHQVHLGTHALGHWTLPFGKMPTIDWDAPATRFAVEKAGLKLAPNPAELANFAEGILSPGLVHKIPVIGPLSKAYSEWLFTDYLPRLKLKTFENAWTRNRAFYDKAIRSGKITEDQLAMRVGDSINNAYGELNQLWLGKHGRDPRVQRALRLGFLAPDFGEARLRFVGKAVKPYSLEERLALGTLFATLYVGARVGNILSHGDPEIEDWKHAFAVKAGDHWYSMRSVLGDTLHAFSNFPNFLYVRLNPAYARGIMEFFTGRDITGRKRTAGEQMLDELKQIVPIHLGGLTRDDQHIWESFSTAIGLGTQRAAPTAEVSQLAGEWRKKRGIETRAETLSDPNSPYRKARIALEFGNRQDFHAAIRELTKQHQLRGDRTPRATIKRAFEQYYTRPFSGSARLEPAFKASLGTREQRKYRDALIERGRLLRQFRQWY